MKTKLSNCWPLVFFIILVCLLTSYFFYMRSTNPSNRATFIVVYGILSTVAILFLTLYRIRKNIYRYKFGSIQNWLRAHIYIGVINLVLVFMHSGFNLSGNFSIFLLLLFLLVIASGVVGSLVYTIVPLSLTKSVSDTKSEDETINSINKILKETDSLMSNASKELKAIYQKKIRSFFRSKRFKWQYLFMEADELINRRRNMIESYSNKVSKQNIHELNILSSMLIEKERLSIYLFKMKMLRFWLYFHAPLTSAMIAATAIHILSTLYY